MFEARVSLFAQAPCWKQKKIFPHSFYIREYSRKGPISNEMSSATSDGKQSRVNHKIHLWSDINSADLKRDALVHEKKPGAHLE